MSHGLVLTSSVEKRFGQFGSLSRSGSTPDAISKSGSSLPVHGIGQALPLDRTTQAEGFGNQTVAAKKDFVTGLVPTSGFPSPINTHGFFSFHLLVDSGPGFDQFVWFSLRGRGQGPERLTRGGVLGVLHLTLAAIGSKKVAAIFGSNCCQSMRCRVFVTKPLQKCPKVLNTKHQLSSKIYV